jgi:anthranilate phosphoribosyltransferase
MMSVQSAIKSVVRGSSLSEQASAHVAESIMDASATPGQIGALLAAMRIRGETVDEIVGFVQAVRARCLPFPLPTMDVIDTCGTGGDGLGTFNVSTVAAFVAAAAGCRVAKHGNRSVSSNCGSADCLEALGVKPDLPPERAAHCIVSAGIGFLFAPLFHQSLRHAAVVRREIGFSSLFNIIGPLVNPAAPSRQLIGVFETRLLTLVAEAMCRLGSRHVLVVHGEDRVDEISLCAPTRVCELRDGLLRQFTIQPEDFGLSRCRPSDVTGADAATNARIIVEVLEGRIGPPRDLVLLNAGAAIHVAGRAETIGEGVRIAARTIDRGEARTKLEELRRLSEGGLQ